MDTSQTLLFNRELSWVAFNGRVLQEAADIRNPLIERLRFLAIYSSNLDEFYKVRVASYRSIMKLKKKDKADLAIDPATLVAKINREVLKQQERFGSIFRDQLVPALREHGVYLIDDTEATQKQVLFSRKRVEQEVLPQLEKRKLSGNTQIPFLEDKHLYMVVATKRKKDGAAELWLVNVPNEQVDRFSVLPSAKKKHVVIQLADQMRLAIDLIFPNHEVLGTYAIKLSRDAELYLEDALEEDLLEKVEKSLGKRSTGFPTRFLYDQAMPKLILKKLRQVFALEREDLVPGGRYHNFHEFFGFPVPTIPELEFPAFPALVHTPFESEKSAFAAIKKADQLLHFPYQQYDYVVKVLDEAAADKKVSSIMITLYRVASKSKIAKALIAAAKSGKKVTAFVEVKARFDEASNLHWMKEMKKAGVEILSNFEDLKVHAKLFVIQRIEGKKQRGYAYFGTGNFNEKTAGIYGDHALLTANEALVNEALSVFNYLKTRKNKTTYKHLLVAPFDLRKSLSRLIRKEMKNAQAGKAAGMTLKMNSLEDPKMIALLYKASQAGVKVNILVRGICCLIPGLKGVSENITVSSIVDRYLEHARIYIFENQGQPKVYMASADLMRRNLNRRVEVAFPILNTTLKTQVLDLIDLQLKDNQKARYIKKRQRNTYRKDGKQPIRAQFETYTYVKALNS